MDRNSDYLVHPAVVFPFDYFIDVVVLVVVVHLMFQLFGYLLVLVDAVVLVVVIFLVVVVFLFD
jgi:hypothetical protein